MISVATAEQIILAQQRDYGTTIATLQQATGRVLAEAITADRDFPPYNRVTMDGIAIRFADFAKSTKAFTIKATQAAGDAPIELSTENECIEIMTGAACPTTTDTIIRYEDLTITDGVATVITDNIRQGQNIHLKGGDKQAGELLVKAGQIITPALINIAASVGKANLVVKQPPRILVLSNGDELVEIDATPTPYQVRRSNSYAITAALQQLNIAADMLHLPDDEATINKELAQCLHNYDVLILSGGVSMGKYDYLPRAFAALGIQQQFHKVQQRPGKPFWFGTGNVGQLVFAFPGNPVSTFMCMYRYFLPWLQSTLGIEQLQPMYAVLDADYTFKPELQYFLQVKISSSTDGRLLATPFEGNGSGDFVNLLYTDAFMELPAEQTNFTKGMAYRIWPYKQIV